MGETISDASEKGYNYSVKQCDHVATVVPDDTGVGDGFEQCPR